MADSNHLSARAEDLADDDPFAELTRIMGQGSFIRPQAVDDDVDALGLDLEKELLGGFAEEDGAAPGLAGDPRPEHPERMEFPELPELNVSEAFGEDDFANDLFKGTDLEEFEQAMTEEPVFASDDFALGLGEDTPVSDAHVSGAGEPVSDRSVFDDFVSLEPTGFTPAAGAYDEPAGAEPSPQFAEADTPFDLTDALFSLHDGGNDAPLRDERGDANYQMDEPGRTYGEEESLSGLFDNVNFREDRPQHTRDENIFDQPGTFQPQEEAFQGFAPSDSETFVAGDPGAAGDLSMDEELERALDLAADWDDGTESSSFAQENYLPDESHGQSGQQWQSSADNEAQWTENASAGSEAEAEDLWTPAPAWSQADEAADWTIDPASIRKADSALWNYGGPSAQADGDRYAQDKQSWTAESGETQWSEPESAPARYEAEAPDYGESLHYGESPHYGESYDGPPDIETIEIPERAVAITESLDLPHVPYHEDVKPAAQLDDIEDLLSGAFGSLDQSTQEAETWDHQENVQQEMDPAQDDFDELLTAGLSAASAAALARNGYVQDESRFDQAPFDQDWNEALAYEQSPRPMPGTPPPAAASGGFLNSRNVRIAALLAGVAVIGIGSVFAFTRFGGSGGGETVIIKADNSPIKERPENPGGTTIPNQDSQVYRQVAGDTSEPGAGQNQLVSSAEEPVQLQAPQDDVEDVLEDEGGFLPQETALDGMAGAESAAKNEERLVNTEQDMTNSSEGFATLTPRRVRSYVVRPDGTMVPREVEAPAANNNTADQQLPGVNNDRVDVAVAGGNNAAQNVSLIPGQQVPPLAGMIESSNAASIGSMPRSAPIPSPRPANVAQTNASQSHPQPQAPNAQAEAQQVAAVQPSAPVESAASSGWSVQIASQPTLEGAQQSYQSLAQRHGTMLQGKGVNIVKAEVQGKGTYYRVRIPASSKNEAISLCESLKTQGGSCFVSQ